MSLIYIAGLSGSGKSTLTELLQERGYDAHDADVELCKWFNNESGKETEYPRDKANRSPDWQEQHTFRMSEEQVAAIASHSNEKLVFILGIAPNDLELAKVYFDKVLFLYISEDEMVHRVTTRVNNKYGHDSDQLAVIKKWYHPIIEKYKKYGATFINAEQPIGRVVEEILQTATIKNEHSTPIEPLPKIVAESYPMLLSDSIKHVGRFIPEVPAHPDLFYDVYRDVENDRILTLVTTDHPDPMRDGEKLLQISEKYSFKDIVIPNSNDDSISIVESDELDFEFFVKENDTYYYVVNTLST